MTISGTPGPLVVFGQNPAQAGTNYQSDYNGDLAPSAIAGGSILLDGRYGFRAALQAGALAAIGMYCSGDILVVDEAPATLAAAAIVAAANPTGGTAMTLVSASGAGVIVSSVSNVSNTLNGVSTVNASGIVYMPVAGTSLPLGTVFINSTPSFIYFGQNGSIAVMDPRNSLTRTLSVTAVAGATPMAVVIRGWDGFGFPISETITTVAGSTVAGKRAFKAVKSVTPATTDGSHTISVGTLDVFGFPMMVTSFAQTEIFFNSAAITASTGFLAGVVTTMTAINGDVRGTYATQAAADGTKLLQMFVNPAPYNAVNTNGIASLFGQTQFTS